MRGLLLPREASRLAADLDRLAALDKYDILDTPPEQGFDDLVELAARLCTAPIAMVSLVARQRQWFKARIGYGSSEISLEESICAHALALDEGDLLIISDLTKDPRTHAKALAAQDGLRFYASAPLVTSRGQVLGSLCVIDREPRPEGLDAEQRTGLTALARQVMAQLELRRSVIEQTARPAPPPDEASSYGQNASALRESELRLRLAIEATGIGIFDYDVATDRLIWDARTRALFGVAPDGPVSYQDTFLPGIHPDDRARADAAVRAAFDPEGPGIFSCDYRTVDRAGHKLHCIEARGRLTVEESGGHRLIGTVRDVSAERSAQATVAATEERYRLVRRATNDAIWDWDLVGDRVLWNEALGTAFGWRPQDVEPTGGWWLDQVHPDDRTKVEATIRTVIDGGSLGWDHEYRFRRANGSYADVLDRGYMVCDPSGRPLRMIGAMLDQTDRKRAEGHLRGVFESANVGIVQLDPRDLRVLRVNAKLCAIWGASEAEIVGQPIDRWTPEEDWAERDALHARLKAGAILRETLEKRFQRADGRLVWARVNIVSHRVVDELQITAMIDDITVEKSAQARHTALIALGDRFRSATTTAQVIEAAAANLGRALSATRAGYATVDLADRTFTIDRGWSDKSKPSAAKVFPLGAFGATIARLRRGELLATDDVAADPGLAADAASYESLGTRAHIKVPLIRRGDLVGVLYAHDTAARPWSRAEIDFAQDVAERTWATLARITAEEQQRMHNRELSHRLKNTLAMVQAIASQSLRGATDIEDVKDVLMARLVALGKAHDILLQGETDSADIEAVITGALAIHDDHVPDRFQLSGPSLVVGPRAAMALALTVHELATNATKYGALSAPNGQVSFAWWIDEDARDKVVRMIWTERGGPKVTTPSRIGFGSRLIQRGMSGAVGGGASIEYRQDGVVCRIAAPLVGFLARD